MLELDDPEVYWEACEPVLRPWRIGAQYKGWDIQFSRTELAIQIIKAEIGDDGFPWVESWWWAWYQGVNRYDVDPPEFKDSMARNAFLMDRVKSYIDHLS